MSEDDKKKAVKKTAKKTTKKTTKKAVKKTAKKTAKKAVKKTSKTVTKKTAKKAVKKKTVKSLSPTPSPEAQKEIALDEIATLTQKHNITLDEIGACLVNLSLKDKSGSWLSRLLGYWGGVFILGGLGLLTAMIWEDLGSAARVVISYGPGIIGFILAILTVKDARFEKASTPLFIQAALLLPIGMFVYLSEYASGDDTQLAGIVVFGILAIQFLVPYIALKRTSLLFFGVLFFTTSLGMIMERAQVPNELSGLSLGLFLLTLAYTVDKTKHRAIAPFYYFVGGIGFLWASFDLLADDLGIDILYLPITLFMMLVSVRVQSRTLLLVSTFSLLGYLSYFTAQYFADVTGWPLALIVLGFILIGISAKAVKLGQSISK